MTNSYSSQHFGNEILLTHLILKHICPKIYFFFLFNSKYKVIFFFVIYFQQAKRGFLACVTFTMPLTLMQLITKLGAALNSFVFLI